MRIVDIETFTTLVRLRHFGKTADLLNTTQPAISSRLANLERELNARLIIRTERHFEITAEGKAALRCFEQMLQSIDCLRQDISHHVPEPAHLAIGAIDAISSTVLPRLAESLRSAAPLIHLDLTVDSTLGLNQRMIEGNLDMVFSLDPVMGEGFRNFVACTFEMSWVGSSGFIDTDREYSVDELAEMPIITFPPNSPPHRMITPYFQSENHLARSMTTSNSLFAMINLVIDRFGVAPIPTVVIRRELQNQLLHRIKVRKPFPPMPIVASYRTISDSGLMALVVQRARESVIAFCRDVDASMAWPGETPITRMPLPHNQEVIE
jgi:DNA-binding transcriptional LysR family regulator